MATTSTLSVNVDTAQAIAEAAATQPVNKVTTVDVLKQPLASRSLGPNTLIPAGMFTTLIGQAYAAVSRSAVDESGNLLPDWQLNLDNVPVYLGNEISQYGIGFYGQSVASLISLGFIKPNTLSLITDPSLTSTVLNNNNSWTGQQGVNGLLDYLNNFRLQNVSQQKIMVGAYQGLQQLEVITGAETAQQLAALLQPAARYGVTDTVAWINKQVTTAQLSDIIIAARQGIYAVDFFKTNSATLFPASDPGGFVNTAQRAELDQLVSALIDNPKIPAITFTTAVANTKTSVANAGGDATFRLNNNR